MKVTPLEIRQKSFERKLRGYDKDEVEAFLLSLSQEWEKMQDQNKDLKLRLETADRELEKLHEVESTLYKTLKTAEDTGQNIVEQAEQKAALKQRESELDAERIIGDAKAESTRMIEEAEIRSDQLVSEAETKAREVSDGMMELLREMEFNYREIQEARDGLLSDLHHMAEDLKGRLEKGNAQRKTRQLNLEEIMEKARKAYRKNQPTNQQENFVAEPLPTFKSENEVEEEPQENQEKKVAEEVVDKLKENYKSEKLEENSFFDELG